ncbi:isoprenyl transferase [bacterium]|nr:MAG: isoprenyl transferase [bacterium]
MQENQDKKLEELVSQIKLLPPERIPLHIAIIMDGNGRWAKRKGLSRPEGHRAGVSAVKKIVRFAPQVGVKILTLYTFSTENWRRPADEVKIIMNLLRETTLRELDELVENGVKLVVSGRFSGLPLAQRKALEIAMKKTAGGDVLTLNLALNYGGRAEIIDAVRKIAEKIAGKKIKPKDIDEKLFEEHLQTAGLPDPDLVIRTSGEIRISNFLLWQSAYSEFYFTDVLWPDFDEIELCRAVIDYASRERRFGGI